MKASTWESIEAFYSSGFEDRFKNNMVMLIKHIRSSDVSSRIFATTSLDKLIVSIYNPLQTFTEALHIQYDYTSRQYIFKYYAIPFKQPELERKYPIEDGIEKFDHWMVMLKW